MYSTRILKSYVLIKVIFVTAQACRQHLLSLIYKANLNTILSAIHIDTVYEYVMHILL